MLCMYAITGELIIKVIKYLYSFISLYTSYVINVSHTYKHKEIIELIYDYFN